MIRDFVKSTKLFEGHDETIMHKLQTIKDFVHCYLAL